MLEHTSHEHEFLNTKIGYVKQIFGGEIIFFLINNALTWDFAFVCCVHSLFCLGIRILHANLYRRGLLQYIPIPADPLPQVQ